jgi:hypothetical protein
MHVRRQCLRGCVCTSGRAHVQVHSEQQQHTREQPSPLPLSAHTSLAQLFGTQSEGEGGVHCAPACHTDAAHQVTRLSTHAPSCKTTAPFARAPLDL